MQTSDKGIALIREHEGLRLTAYPDPAHGWKVATIGYGHTSAAGPPTVKQGMRITEAEAIEILRRDLAKFEGYVRSMVHVPLTQGQFDALVSFTFNLGPGNLQKSTLLKKLNAGDYTGAAGEFGKWNRAGGKVLPGLTRRRADERFLFLSHVATPPPPKPAFPTPDSVQRRAESVSIAIAVTIALAAFFLLKG